MHGWWFKINIRELIEKSLIEIIEEIQSTKELIIKNKYEKLENEYAQSLYEKKLMGNIANVVGKDNKPIFGNESKRQIEFLNQTQTDIDYQSLKEYNKKLSKEKDKMYSKLEILEKVFDAKKLEMELRKWLIT